MGGIATPDSHVLGGSCPHSHSYCSSPTSSSTQMPRRRNKQLSFKSSPLSTTPSSSHEATGHHSYRNIGVEVVCCVGCLLLLLPTCSGVSNEVMAPKKLFTKASKTSVGSLLPSPTADSSSAASSLCLGLEDIFVALFLVIMILMTILGNILVVLSVFLYKRMRTFTNFLLTSLATADLLVGLLIMPLSLIDFLHDHNWPFGHLICRIWATSDVLLCTASILNLCIISLDRYMAITSPLKYPRTRSKFMAFVLLCLVWGISMIVCSPPWFIPEWNIFFNSQHSTRDTAFACAYSPSIPYRIYSALVSFYIPLMVMLFVYFKIFRVASERERIMRQGLGTCRLSRRVEKTQRKGVFQNSSFNNYHNRLVANV